MAKKKNKKKHLLGPIVMVLCLIVFIILLSSVLSALGIDGNKVSIVNGSLETSLVTIRSLFSKSGMQFLLGGAIDSFRLFEPLVLLIITLVAISIMEASGLLKHLFEPLKKLNFKITTFLVVFIGVISSLLGEHCYIIMLPLAGVFYKYLNKSSALGIITMFLAITLGYATSIFYNYDDYLIGMMSQNAAIVSVDKNYLYGLLSNIYIMLFSTFAISIFLSYIINKYLSLKFEKKVEFSDEKNTSKQGLLISGLSFLFLIGLVVIMILPNGILLDNSKQLYVAKLFSETSPFKDAIIYIMLLIAMIISYIYGFIAKNFTNTHDYSWGLTKGFDNLGYLFVLMFFSSILVGIIDWTNIGVVLGTNLVSLLSVLDFSGVPLILATMAIIILMSILMPGNVSKWTLLAPVLIPLFMRANLTPDYAQFIFKVADAIGKSITPMFIYFIIMFGFVQKYNTSENKITVFDTLKLTIPTILMTAGLWILIVIGFYIVGLPLGINTFTTL